MDTPKDPSKYYTTFTIENHEDGLTLEEVKALGDHVGATHDMLTASMIHTPDGGLSTLFRGMHHTGRELSPTEYFKVWLLLTKNVLDQLEADPEEPKGEHTRVGFLKVVWETIQGAISGDHSCGDPDCSANHDHDKPEA